MRPPGANTDNTDLGRARGDEPDAVWPFVLVHQDIAGLGIDGDVSHHQNIGSLRLMHSLQGIRGAIEP